MTSERKFIEENVKRVLLKEYLKRKTERSGFGGLDIQRTPMGTRVTLIAERPGMVIGRKGETIKELTDYVQNEFKFDNPQIEVKEESNPNLNPHIMAQKLASALERGWHFRRAGHSTVRRIMSAGAKGCQVIISGKLTGQRHRTEKFREGNIKYCGETKLNWMREGFAVAKKKLGVIGIKVQIMDPNAKLPDEIELKELKDVATIKTDQGEAVTELKSEQPAQPEVSPEVEVTSEVTPGAEAEVEVETTEASQKPEEEEPKKGKKPKKETKKSKTIEKSTKKSEKTTKKKSEKKAKDSEAVEEVKEDVKEESKEETKDEPKAEPPAEAPEEIPEKETPTEEPEPEPEPPTETPEEIPEAAPEEEPETTPEPEVEPGANAEDDSKPDADQDAQKDDEVKEKEEELEVQD